MIRAKFGPTAAQDLETITRYITSDNHEAAQRVRGEILGIQHLGDASEMRV
jgi:plasmid stabilization system protein ParE